VPGVLADLIKNEAQPNGRVPSRAGLYLWTFVDERTGEILLYTGKSMDLFIRHRVRSTVSSLRASLLTPSAC